MTRWEKAQPILIMAAVLLGLLTGIFVPRAEEAGFLVVPFLFIMLFGVFLHIPLRDFRQALGEFRVTGTTLLTNFLWNPFFAWLLGWLFLRNAPELWVGLIMLMVTPCTDWYLVFTAVSRGNIALGTALLPWNLVLQLVLLPLYLLLLAGAIVEINRMLLLQNIAAVLLLPLTLAVVFRYLVIRSKGETWLENYLLPRVSYGQFLFLSLAIAAMFASQGNLLLNNPQIIAMLLLPVMLFFFVNFLLVQLISRVLNFSYANRACFTCTALARNSPVALAIAVSAFPDRPLIALVLVVGPLLELPILSLASYVLLFFRSK